MNPYPKRGCRLRSVGLRRNDKRFDSCYESSKHRATNPLGEGLVVGFGSLGQLLSFSLRKPDGHDLALGFTFRQLRPSGFTLLPACFPHL